MAKSRRATSESEARPITAPSRRPLLGQNSARRDLGELLAAGRLPPALIFHGPAGVGKMTTALRVAALLLDPSADESSKRSLEPPSDTESAELIAAGTHPDLHLVAKHRCADSQVPELRERKQTNIPIDLLRELVIGGTVAGHRFEAPVQRTAYRGHGKVFLVDEAELLDSAGQNALLKVMEEPPPQTWIILGVTDRTRLLPTLRSRCHQVAFAPLDAAAMEQWFKGLDPPPQGDALRWLANFAQGSPGRATLALENGLATWDDELSRRFAALAEGEGGVGFAEAMAELVKSFAEARVKRDPRASKEAANRLATGILFSMLGSRLRSELAASAEAHDLAATSRWAEWIERLDLADRHLDANVSLVHALADLVASWENTSLAASPRS